ncbi:hypothetical protein FRC0522_01361 [Corynebacterium diphtheriae]|nr:hypothetical protein FRC0522_01361 [Corynebacterium diphtheriae]
MKWGGEKKKYLPPPGIKLFEKIKKFKNAGNK